MASSPGGRLARGQLARRSRTDQVALICLPAGARHVDTRHALARRANAAVRNADTGLRRWQDIEKGDHRRAARTTGPDGHGRAEGNHPTPHTRRSTSAPAGGFPPPLDNRARADQVSEVRGCPPCPQALPPGRFLAPREEKSQPRLTFRTIRTRQLPAGAPSTEHRAPSTEHRAPSAERRAPSTG